MSGEPGVEEGPEVLLLPCNRTQKRTGNYSVGAISAVSGGADRQCFTTNEEDGRPFTSTSTDFPFIFTSVEDTKSMDDVWLPFRQDRVTGGS